MTTLPDPVDHYQTAAEPYDGNRVLKAIVLGVLLGLLVWGAVLWAGRHWGCW